MQSQLLSTALISLLTVTGPADSTHTTVSKTALGSIRGAVLDTSCTSAGPLAFATVVVLGTKRGALSEEDGTYDIDAIAPGIYDVKAFWIGLRPEHRHAVEVAPGKVTNIDFHMARGSDWRPPRDLAKECDSICGVHRQRMKRVLVPASYGLKVLRPGEEDRRARYPNASFVWDAGCVIGGTNAAWDYRCPACIDEWNRIEGDGGERIASVYDSSWRTCSLRSRLSFRGPSLLETEASSDSCFLRGLWIRDGISVRAFVGNTWRMPAEDPTTFTTHGEIIDDQYTDVRMVSKGSRRTFFTYLVLPDSPQWVRFEVSSADKGDLRVLLGILRSLRLSSS